MYISRLIRYSRACGSYQDFLDRELLLTRKLLNQGLLVVKFKSSLRKFYGCHHDLVNHYGAPVSQMTTDMFRLSQSQSGHFLFHDITEFVTKVIRQMPHMEQEMLTFRCTCVHPLFCRSFFLLLVHLL